MLTGKFSTGERVRMWIGPLVTVLLLVSGAFTFVYSYGVSIHDNEARSIKNERCVDRVGTAIAVVEKQLTEVSVTQRESVKRQDRLEGKIDQVLRHVMRGNPKPRRDGDEE